jgi:hypothetical protein
MGVHEVKAKDELTAAEAARQDINTFLTTSRDHIMFNPEFSQRHFFLIVPPKAVPRASESNMLVTEQADVTRGILQASSETRATIFVPSSGDIDPTRRAYFTAMPALRRLHSVGRLEFRVGRYTREIWARDLGTCVLTTQGGESASTAQGGSVFIRGIPINRRVWTSPRPRLAPHNPSDLRIPVTQIPLLFEGGDLTLTRVGKRQVVIAGPQLVDLTRKHYQSNKGYMISDEEIRKILKHAFSADAVLLLRTPKRSPPKLAFHIDQAVFFPKNGTAVMLDPDSIGPGDDPDLAEIKGALISYRDQLRKAGFRVVEIPTSSKHVLNLQAYTNAIPITEKGGRTRVIIPSFGDASLERRIGTIIRNEGIEVEFVRNHTYIKGGNPHCITGALARADDVQPRRLRGLVPRRAA